MEGIAPPKILKTQRSIQSSYETPHRIYEAKTYPVSSSNGSTIIIYGHESGVRLVWRGGQQFKESVQKPVGKPPASNGTSNDVYMILDSDEEDAVGSGSLAVEDEPEFEDEEDDSRTSSPTVIQFLDIFFGTSGVHLAVPTIPITSHKAASQLRPEILSQKIVFAVVCGDNTTRIISLPLTPPSPASKLRKDLLNTTTSGKAGDGKWNESIAILAGHHAIADGVSFTFTTQPIEKPTVRDLEKKDNASSEWILMLASHSQEISGLLLIYNIPIISTSKNNTNLFSISAQSFEPLQRQYLPSPAVSISFKPLLQSTTRSTHLLIAHKSGVIKIYDPLPVTGVGALSSNAISSQGEWLLSLYLSTNGDAVDASAANHGRKSIIDARWILSGKAIIVLCSDGEWGILDVENAGPKHGSVHRQSGIRGGANTPFTISGSLEGFTKSSSSRSSSSQQSNASKFAPLTPGTRRTVESTLFNSRNNHHGNTQGQLVVTRLASPSPAIQGNECVIFWLQESFAVIPNLWSYWDNQARKSEGGSNPFGGSTSGITRIIKLETISLQGERCTFVDHFPKDLSLLSSRNVVPLDILITGEHRFVISSDTRGDLIHSRSELENNNATISEGDLDVGSINQALSRMENDNNTGNEVVRRGVSFLR